MLQELRTANKVVGVKQLRKALREGTARKVFIAENADLRLTDPIRETCQNANVPTESVTTMAELGDACGIAVGAAVAAIVG